MARGGVIGRPGAGLDNAAWAKNDAVARVGKSGEIRTAVVLDGLARADGGPTVLHDVRIPLRGVTANIDHVVVSGRGVYLVDAKVWKPGFYWTVGGRTFRGLSRFGPADKKTMRMARDAVDGYLRNQRTGGRVRRALLVVWPSSTRGSTSLWAFRPVGARAVTAGVFTRAVRRLVGTKPADPAVVSALSGLVNGLASRPVPHPPRPVGGPVFPVPAEAQIAVPASRYDPFAF